MLKDRVSGGFAQFTLADPASLLTAPADGTVTGWRVNGQVAGSGKIFLHVVRRTGPDKYLGIRDSDEAASTDGVTPNPTSLEMDVDDLISVTTVSSNLPGAVAQVNTRTSPGSDMGYMAILSAGGTYTHDPLNTIPDRELLVNATVELYAPQIVSLSAYEGPLGGGTPVTITGDHLAIATSVKFGNVEAPIVAADNDSITTESPPNPAGGPVNVTVTTAGGPSEATPATRFTYPKAKPPDDGKLPKISRVKFRNREFAAANIGGPVVATRTGDASASARVGSKVSYTLSEDAKVFATVKRLGKNRRFKKAGKRFAVTGTKGRNSFFFSGRLVGKSLRPGRYRMVFEARDSAGNWSRRPVVAPFRIIR